MSKSPETEPPQENPRPLTPPVQNRILRAVTKKQNELLKQRNAERAARNGAESSPSAPATRTEKAIAIGAVAAVAAGVLVYGGKVADKVSNIVEDRRYSQLDMGEGKGIFGELKDAAELGNDMQSGTVDPSDLTGLLPNDSTGWKESRSLTSTPTSLPHSLPVPETKQS